MSRTRRLIDIETHQAVFQWVLQVLTERNLLKGNTIGVDATTLEANVALPSIVRRDTGEQYDEFLKRLAKENGIETLTREQRAKVDRKRPKKGSNDEWQHPHDPDARITKMKDGRTHLAPQGRARRRHRGRRYRGGHGPACQRGEYHDDRGYGGRSRRADCGNGGGNQHEEAGERVNPERRSEIVTDKGYHSRESDKRSPRLESARTARSRNAGRNGGEDNIGNSKPYMPTAAAFGTSEASGYCGNAARSSSVGTNTSTNAVECDGSTCEVGKTS